MTPNLFPRSWLARWMLAAMAGLPGCSEYSVCMNHAVDCQLAPQARTETIFFGESQALQVQLNPSGEAAYEQSRRSRQYVYGAELTTPSRTLKTWQSLSTEGPEQTSLTLLLQEADQMDWPAPPAGGGLNVDLELTQQILTDEGPRLAASGSTQLTLKVQALTLNAPALFAQDASLDKFPGGAKECVATTAQLGIVNQEIWALVPRFNMTENQCLKTWRSCAIKDQSLQCFDKSMSMSRDEFTVEPHESLAAFAASADPMKLKPLLWLQRKRAAAGSFVPALCTLANLMTGCDPYAESTMPLKLDAHAVAVSQDAGFAALLQKNGLVQKRRLEAGFPATETGLMLAPVAGVPGYIAAARLSGKQGSKDVIVAAWGGQLGLASGAQDGMPAGDPAASVALTTGFARIAGAGAKVSGLALGDVDGDDQLDLVVAYGAQIYVALGRGFPAFSWTTKPELGRKLTLPDMNNDLISAVAIGDLNGDGKADLAAVSRLSQKYFALLAK